MPKDAAAKPPKADKPVRKAKKVKDPNEPKKGLSAYMYVFHFSF